MILARPYYYAKLHRYSRSRRNLIIPERPWRIALSLVSTFDVISNSRRNVNCEGGNVNSILPPARLSSAGQQHRRRRRRRRRAPRRPERVVNFTTRIKKLIKNRRSRLIIPRVSRGNGEQEEAARSLPFGRRDDPSLFSSSRTFDARGSITVISR